MAPSLIACSRAVANPSVRSLIDNVNGPGQKSPGRARLLFTQTPQRTDCSRLLDRSVGEFYQIPQTCCISKSMQRRTRAQLRGLGWSVFIAWECQAGDQAMLAKLVRRLLGDL